jgi:aryl-alcohol dehydrogenase-like predicted oxidoreductase
MDYVRFGGTGLEVSRLVLGCMTFGVPDRGTHPWTLDEAASRPIIKKAVELGINFFDTANVYSDGTSEEIVGRALKDFASRDEVVIATKLNGRMRKGPNGAGLSRKTIFSEIDHSLRRLGTDYVDLYQIHRWDPNVPIEETLEALHDVVKAGKARYIGASSMHAYQFAQAVYKARLRGWTEFCSMQNYVNLLYREEERDMLPFCADEKIAVIPWSPLARGRLTRDWNETTARGRPICSARPCMKRPQRPIGRWLKKSPKLQKTAACPGRKWLWHGSHKSRGSPRRSSGLPRNRIWMTRWRH